MPVSKIDGRLAFLLPYKSFIINILSTYRAVWNLSAREGFNLNECGAVTGRAARNNMPKTKTYRAWLVGVVLAGVLLLLHSPTISLAQDQDQTKIRISSKINTRLSSQPDQNQTRIHPAWSRA